MFLYQSLILMATIFTEMVTVASSPRPSSHDGSLEIEMNTEYLKIAKMGGGHKGKFSFTELLSIRAALVRYGMSFFPSK